MASLPAPGDLRVVQLLVNTQDLDGRTDALADPAALGPWLETHGLGQDGTYDERDLERVHAVRGGLRAVLLTHNGSEPDRAAVAALDAESGRAGLTLSFGSSPVPALEPLGTGIDAALARLFAIVARAAGDGTWERLKACPAEHCEWAFYDHSRNHSRTWCSMEVCGNRAKARTYRRRAYPAGSSN